MRKLPTITVALVSAAATFTLLIPARAQPSPSAVGDPVAGARTFGQCRSCHTATAAAPDGIGPNLFGVYNSKAGTRRKGYAYSPAVKKSKLVWNDTTLDRWLTNPAATVPGTKMAFIGLQRKPMRDNVIAYLKTLK